MNVEEKLRGFLSKSAEVSKNVLSKAGEAVQEFSDKSVVKIDKLKLENQRNKKISDLGQIVYNLFNSSEEPLSADSEELKPVLDDIKEIEKEIAEKIELLKEFDESNDAEAPAKNE